jgi:hypothetical protein
MFHPHATAPGPRRNGHGRASSWTWRGCPPVRHDQSAGLPPRSGALLCPRRDVPIVVPDATHGRGVRRPRGGRRFARVVRPGPQLAQTTAAVRDRVPALSHDERAPGRDTATRRFRVQDTGRRPVLGLGSSLYEGHGPGGPPESPGPYLAHRKAADVPGRHYGMRRCISRSPLCGSPGHAPGPFRVRVGSCGF